MLYGAGGSGKSALLSKTALQSLKVTMKGDFTSDSGSKKWKVKVKPEKLFKRKSFPKQDCSRIPQGNNKGAIGRGSRLKVESKSVQGTSLTLTRNGFLLLCLSSCVDTAEQHQTPRPWDLSSSIIDTAAVSKLNILLQGRYVSRSLTPTCFPSRTSLTTPYL